MDFVRCGYQHKVTHPSEAWAEWTELFRSGSVSFPVHPRSIVTAVVTFEEVDRRLKAAAETTATPGPTLSAPPPSPQLAKKALAAAANAPAVAANTPAVADKGRASSTAKAAVIPDAKAAAIPDVKTAVTAAPIVVPVADAAATAAATADRASAAKKPTATSTKKRTKGVSIRLRRNYGEMIELIWTKALPRVWLVLRGATPGMYHTQ